jgi:uncharacterized protein (DUF983 family)
MLRDLLDETLEGVREGLRGTPMGDWLADGRAEGGRCPACGEMSLYIEDRVVACDECGHEQELEAPGWL